MHWALEYKKGERIESVTGVSFDPSDVLRLSRLSHDLPWLGALDPYRANRVAGADLLAASRDVGTVLERYTSEFLADFARTKRMSITHLHSRPHLLKVATDCLSRDHFYHLLKEFQVLLSTAQEQSISVQVLET